jgi:hypothetical protein
MITVEDYLTTHGKHPERMAWVSQAVERNAQVTVSRVNGLYLVCGFSRRVSGGFRDMLSNKRIKNASPYSRHQTGEAADLEDFDGKLKAWASKNADSLIPLGLWCEPFHLTPSWLHVQTTPVPSGLRIAP